MCRSRKHHMIKANTNADMATFDWNHPEVILGNTFRVCNDSLCEAIGGCGCPDTDIYQFIQVWNNSKMEYDELCVPIDKVSKYIQ